jgi:hypothetical protein
MHKNGDHNVVDFLRAKSHRVSICGKSSSFLPNLTNMHQKASACLGLRVAMVPELYQWYKFSIASTSNFVSLLTVLLSLKFSIDCILFALSIDIHQYSLGCLVGP